MIADYCPWKYRGAGCKYGQLFDFNEQNVQVGNTTYQYDDVFINAGNLGLPLADEKDKLFFDSDGYNLQSIRYRGDYDNTQTNYIKGDIVRLRPSIKIFGKDGIRDAEQDLNNSCDHFFICIKDVTSAALDPRYEREFWVADQCSRTLNGCRIRFKHYGEYSKGLPFGGFPSIESYNF